MQMSSQLQNKRIEVIFPLKTVSEANCSEHWTKKHKRHKEQKRIVRFILERYRNDLKTPCNVKVTRCAARSLDVHDNLPMSLKYVVDAICEMITGKTQPGQADNDKSIQI